MKHQYYFVNRGLIIILISFSLLSKLAAQYDIYAYDIKKGTTRKVTNMGTSASAYNVSWSNNGKKIAHDIVGAPAYPFNQSIFVTDVGTGVTSPLIGGEGGNDAAWSPNGEKIAFDDYHLFPYNIYSVPSSGGARTTLRYNAHHASWNPKGNKIAFDDNFSAYIGTKDIYTSNETFVTFYGDRPAWSPNGQYIAFDGWSWVGGGVWIIKVDTLGNPVGSPKQLTTSGYGPTWKNNSKELIFVDWPNGDPDLYTIPITGGPATRLTGRIGGFDKGDYDPAYSNNGQYVAWSSYTDTSVIVLNQKQNGSKLPMLNAENNLILDENYPNPFSTQTRISFHVKNESHIKITIYNSLGQKINTLADGNYKAGDYIVTWDGRGTNNQLAPGGTYFCQIQDERTMKVRKMVRTGVWGD